MLKIANTIIAIEYGVVVLAIASLSLQAAKHKIYWLVGIISISGILVFLSCGLHHFAHAWLSYIWEIRLTWFCAFGSLPLTVFSIAGRKKIWEGILFPLTAQFELKRLQISYDSSACGLCELKHIPEKDDFVFTRCNLIGREIIKNLGGPEDITGYMMCDTIKGHRDALDSENGLSTYEIYKKVAYKYTPYESGKRDAVLTFPSPVLGIQHFKQVVLQVKPGVISIGFVDISEKINLIEKLKKQTITDDLTGLYTRAFMFEALDNAVKGYKERKEQWCEIRIDLDKMKRINDTHGHHAGDKAIIWIANQIKASTRGNEVVARFSGDEFGVLVQGDTSIGKRAAERIRYNIESKGSELKLGSITVSLGVASVDDSVRDGEMLDVRADIAQNKAKEERNKVVVWGDNDDAEKTYQLEREILNAVKNEEFTLYFQPIVLLNNCFDGNILLEPKDIQPCGFEGLVRWDRPGKESVGPAVFIEILEKTNNLFPLTGQILRMAGEAQNRFRELGMDKFISVNLSANDLSHDDFEDISKPIEGKGFSAEVTERYQLDAKGIKQLRRLKNLGGKVSIDDYGTGWSNLLALSSGLHNTIKIDRVFVEMLMQDQLNKGTICATSVVMAKSLGMATIAEGVEHEEQLYLLRAMGCDYIQGFWYSEAQPLDYWLPDLPS